MSVLAVGDSITRGDNTMVGDLPCRSYAHWVADALGTAATVLAEAGLTSAQVLDRFGDQIAGQHQIGMVFVGANDALAASWQPEVFRASHGELLRRVGEHAERVVTLTIPAHMGRFLGKRRTADLANVVIRENAAESDALVADLGDLSGSRYVWADQIHPTSWGQVEIADRVAATLGLGTLPGSLAADRMTDPGWRYTAAYLRFGARSAVRQSGVRVVRRARLG